MRKWRSLKGMTIGDMEREICELRSVVSNHERLLARYRQAVVDARAAASLLQRALIVGRNPAAAEQQEVSGPVAIKWRSDKDIH